MKAMFLLFAALLFPGPDFAPEAPPSLQQSKLLGMWRLYESARPGDPVRFYYFHDGKIGLYRYGRIGLNNTNSFDYQQRGDQLVFVFRKTGERCTTRFRIERERGREWLILSNDPRERTETRYFRNTSSEGDGEPLLLEEPAQGWGRMWVDQRKFATGGLGFRIYQFKDPKQECGIGWYHQGDYDDWSTESLDYCIGRETLRLTFRIRGERAESTYRVEGAGKGRTLWLQEDPRNFWQQGLFLDRGASF